MPALTTYEAIVGRDTIVFLEYFYGPQVALPFILSRTSVVPGAAPQSGSCSASLVYFACVYLRLAMLRQLSARIAGFVALCAIAFPPLFHFFVRGQISVLVLVCFTSAYFWHSARDRDWLAGIALGLPRIQAAIPGGHPVSPASAPCVEGVRRRRDFRRRAAWHSRGSISARPSCARTSTRLLQRAGTRPTELSLSPIQMHSLRIVLGTPDPVAARRVGPLCPNFVRRNLDRRSHLEVYPPL